MKNLDILRYYPEVTVNNEEGFRTSLGGVLSVIMGLLISLAIILYGKSVVYKLNPTTLTTTEVDNHQIIDRSQLFFAIGLFVSGGISIEERDKYIKIEFGAIDLDGTRTGETAFYNFYSATNCSETSTVFIDNDNLNEYRQISEKEYFCPHHLKNLKTI